VTDSPKTLVEARSNQRSKIIVDSLKVTGAKSDLGPGSFMSTGANAPVAPVESAPMDVQYSSVGALKIIVQELRAIYLLEMTKCLTSIFGKGLP